MVTKKKTKSSDPSFLSGYISADNPIPPNPSITPQFIYNQNYLEWALKNREQIFISSSLTGGSTVMYTVPSGKVLYLTSANLVNSNSSTSSSRVVYIYTPQGKIISSFVGQAIAGLITPTETVTQSFPFPIKILPGTEITLFGNSSASSLTVGSFIGFLEFLD